MPVPFPLPVISRGFALLSPSLRELGARAAAEASRALSGLLGEEVTVVGHPLPGPADRAIGLGRIAVALEALPAVAELEVDTRLMARTVERLAGSAGGTRAALDCTPVEQSLLELLALVAIDGAWSPWLDGLVPRLVASGEAAPDALVVALDLSVGGDHGRGRLRVPAAAVGHLRTLAELHPSVAALSVPGSLREGASSLTPEELAALAPGDVLLLDTRQPGSELVLPGGLALRGRRQADHLHVAEIHMTETQATYPITLAVEIARVTVTLGDLSRLEPGAALPLGVTTQGAVVLRAGERAVARGELVEIDGALGVRLAQVGEWP